MRGALILLLLLIQIFPASAQNILFVGNSLSYYNDMPIILEKIAKELSKNIDAECLCKPNFALIDHWNEGELKKKLNSGNYDYIILQQGPSSQEYGKELLIEYGMKIKDYADSKGIKTAFLMVWPSIRYYHTFEGVIQNYQLAADTTNSVLIPLGEIWKNYTDKFNQSLYSEDQFHPSKKGSFFIAFITFQSLYPHTDMNWLHYSKVKSYLDYDDFKFINPLLE